MESIAVLDRYFQKMPVGFAVIKVLLDENSCAVNFRFQYMNQAFVKLEQYSQEQLLNNYFYDLYPNGDQNMLTIAFDAAYNGKQSMIHQYSSEIEKSLFMMCYPWNEKGLCALLIFDESELVATQKELEYLNNHDLMTKLKNRNAYIRYCETFLENNITSLGVVFLDMNGLKKINDHHGHEYGDNQIIELANLMQQYFCENQLFRISGDEFVVLFENCEEDAFIQQVKIFKNKIGKKERCLASCGYIWECNPKCVEDLVRQADQFMYIKKKQYYIHADVFGDSHSYSLQELLNDLQNGRFLFYLQPKMDQKNNCFLGAEAFARYQSHEDQILHPSSFLELFKRNNLVTYLDYYIFESVCKWLNQHINDKRYQNFKISVNFDIETLSSISFVNRLEKIRTLYHVTSVQLSISIAKIKDKGYSIHVLKNLERLKVLGYQIELDHFGSCDVPIEALSCDSLDIIKISSCLIKKAMDSSLIKTMLVGICENIKNAGMKCLAEGIENAQQHILIQSLPIDYAQGYYYAEPMPLDEFEEWYSYHAKSLDVLQ